MISAVNSERPRAEERGNHLYRGTRTARVAVRGAVRQAAFPLSGLQPGHPGLPLRERPVQRRVFLRDVVHGFLLRLIGLGPLRQLLRLSLTRCLLQYQLALPPGPRRQ